MLANLLPGLREIRAPLVSGYLWLVFFFLLFHEDLPTRETASSTLEPLFDLAHDLSALGVATVSGIAAYLVGSAVQELLKLLCAGLPGKPFYGEAGTHLSTAGRADLERAVEIRIQAIRRRLFQVAVSPGEKGVNDEPSARSVERELPLIRTLLLGEHADLIGELDRLQAEADLRITVAIPIVFFSFLFAIEISPGWLLALVAAGLLLAQGYQRQIEAGDLLAKALRIGKVSAPSLESLDASSAAAVERIELEEELARKVSDGRSAMAAFRLGNLQATGENFEGAIGSLRFAAENGVIHAYAEMGLVYERLGELDDAEQVYRDGEKRKDQRAAERLAGLLRRLARDEEALEMVQGVERQATVTAGTEEPDPPSRKEGSRIVDYTRRVRQGDAKAALNLGLLRRRRGEWDKAIESLEQATQFDSGDAQAWLALGSALNDVRRSRAAAAAYGEALAILERTFGGEHLEVASALTGLGAARIDMREFEKAGKAAERALVIYEREIGPDSLEVAASAGALSRAQLGLGEFSVALELAERSLAIRERTLSPDQPMIAIALQQLGLIRFRCGDYMKGKECFERATEIHEGAPGPNGDHLAISLQNLGEIYNSIGEYGRARAHHERALDIKRKGLPEEHVSIALSLIGLGVSRRGLGEYTSALELQESGLAMLDAGDTYAEEIVDGLIAISATLRHLDRFEEARRFSRRATVLAAEESENDFLLRGKALVERGNTLSDQDVPAARLAFEDGRDLIAKVAGEKHLFQVEAYIGLGRAHRRLDNNHSSLRALQTAISVLDEAPVEHEAARAAALREMAETQYRQGNLDGAKASVLESIDARERVGRPDHPEIVTSLDLFASLLQFGGDVKAAEEARGRAEKIRGGG